MKFRVEEIFKTEGIPEYTFVPPPNYNEILVDMRNSGKPVIIEGQSGTGKTTTVKKILEMSFPSSNYVYLSARKSADIPKIEDIANGNKNGWFILDDFHRLNDDIQTNIANIIKIASEDYDPKVHPKIVIIGINKVGSELIHLVHDIAKRCGIHRIQPADENATRSLISKGEEKLNVKMVSPELIHSESRGDYWVTQLLCQIMCLSNNVLETTDDCKEISVSLIELRNKVASRLESAYQEPVKEFCRGKRFRSTNDPYYKLLKAIGSQNSSIIDLVMLANQNEEVRGSINNIKDKRLTILIESKPICERYFYYNSETNNFAIEDPALFYYIKNLDWGRLRTDCGFKDIDNIYEYDFALSFAGENRELAKIIASQLETIDCSVFYDEYFEANYLGKAWGAKFQDIFKNKSRFVVALLDQNHNSKIWPTFERECFIPRIADEAVIPIYLDDTVFIGIPRDIVGITFDTSLPGETYGRVTDEIVFKLYERLNSV